VNYLLFNSFVCIRNLIYLENFRYSNFYNGQHKPTDNNVLSDTTLCFSCNSFYCKQVSNHLLHFQSSHVKKISEDL
jgi:hypothetical protein